MPREDKLTSRQVEILNFVKLGFGNKQVAAKLGIGMQSVKNQLTIVFFKLGAIDRAHAVYLALKRGIIE